MNECFKESKGYRVPKENLDLAFDKDGTILVIENPTRDYFGALYIVSKELRGLATTKDLYFWQADEATHDSMKEALLKNFGIKIKDPYCGIYYKNDTLFLDGYQYLNGNYDLDFKEKSKPIKVMCVNTGSVYNSANKASKDTGCTASAIIQCCKGNYDSSSDKNGNKLKWVYVND